MIFDNSELDVNLKYTVNGHVYTVSASTALQWCFVPHMVQQQQQHGLQQAADSAVNRAKRSSEDEDGFTTPANLIHDGSCRASAEESHPVSDKALALVSAEEESAEPQAIAHGDSDDELSESDVDDDSRIRGERTLALRFTSVGLGKVSNFVKGHQCKWKTAAEIAITAGLCSMLAAEKLLRNML
ncbi:unnamed protein product [Lampetra planeri]